MQRPLLIYDGDCSFCRRWITRWQHLTGDAVDYEPYQSAAEKVPHIPRENFGQAVHLVDTNGSVSRGAEAVFRSLALAGHKRYLLWLYEHVPPFEKLTEAIYGFIARHRDPIDKLDRVIVGTETRPASYVLTRALFLRLLGVVYLIAFLSLYVQMDGLFSSNGILPAAGFVDAATRVLHASRWWTAPTLAYFSASDAFLHALCIGGIVCSCLLIIGVAPLLMTAALWAGYLSLVMVGQIFLGYQWDALLLEAGFLAIFWSPPLWAGARNAPPSRIVLFMLRWLLFRLMVLSALVKWFANDDCWRKMTALRYHFETQPIPTSTSWYAHHNPHWLLAVACFCMFVTEGIIPFLYFAPRRTRMLAFWLTVLFQLSIMATGNYGFFNVLTIVLAVTLLDDSAVARVLRMTPPPLKFSRPRLRPFIVAPTAVVLFVVGVIAGINHIPRVHINWPTPLARLHRSVTPFMIANWYGLFQDMTRKRYEIIVEGSDDGRDWKAYEFKWKPGDVNRAPGFCEPHMPRLDWQMWFVPLRPRENQEWFVGFAFKLLQGQPEVLKLMAKNPFPAHPPKFIRAVAYEYHFSDDTMRKASGAWWTREPIGIFLPPLSLQQQRSPIDDSFRL